MYERPVHPLSPLSVAFFPGHSASAGSCNTWLFFKIPQCAMWSSKFSLPRLVLYNRSTNNSAFPASPTLPLLSIFRQHRIAGYPHLILTSLALSRHSPVSCIYSSGKHFHFRLTSDSDVFDRPPPKLLPPPSLFFLRHICSSI